VKSHSLAVTLTGATGSPPAERSNAARKARSSPRNAPSTIRQALEIAGETLWVLLLSLVVGFVVAKAPQINTAIDQISGGPSAPAARAMDASHEAQIRDLQTRFALYESKLVPLEKGYAQLKQRHADLLKAYADLRRAHVREATSEIPVAGAHPVAAP
jgi:uncharacterized protein HemX